MSLTDQWRALEAALPAAWSEARLGLRVAGAGEREQAAALLAPLEPLETDSATLAVRVIRHGDGATPAAVRRGLARLDERGLRGTLSVLGAGEQAPRVAAAAPTSLAQAWWDALATVPADWSDLLGEIELGSSDYLDRAAVNLAPLNPRRSGERTALRFRSARSFGYGAAPGLVGACLERCARDGIGGRVRILRVLCDTKPSGTQGPVWQIDGEMV